MGTSRIHSITLLAGLIAGLLAFANTHGLVTSVAGLAVLGILAGYDERGARSGTQSFAFAAVCGLALLCGVFYPVGLVAGDLALPPFLAKEISGISWLVFTFVFFFLDRARMNARNPLSFRGPTQYAPQYAAQPPTQPAPVFVAPAAPVYQQPTFAPPPPVAEQAPPREQRPYTAPEPQAQPAYTPAPPPQATAAPPSGKPVTIYVNMVGEGMNLLRPVKAEFLGRDFYIIVEEMPPDEKWEFTQGQVVRCKKKTLSHGKALVAYEEAPRAQ